ncbi:hypothetical protein R1sor_013890 [Riccia sorocarpa]|uniref:Uncharacterized protein n=1 Tax=Riccia sorocarpa TaxID=122646 RepID=A0ABD3HBZ7_9MARC
MSEAGAAGKNEKKSTQASGMEAVKCVVVLQGNLSSHADLIHALSGAWLCGVVTSLPVSLTVGSSIIEWLAMRGMLALAAGTYGSHIFKPQNLLYKDVWNTANLYHLTHTAALLAVPLTKRPQIFGTLLTFGIVAFSGSNLITVDGWIVDKQLPWKRRTPKRSGVSHVPVTIRGLTPSGYLLATDEQGEQYELHPDGNSFDFLKGLVRAKLSS